MTDSGEYALQIHDTEPCDPPSDPEAHVPTLPSMPAAPRFDLTTDVFVGEDLER